jgi:preprotein translocase subunit SecA
MAQRDPLVEYQREGFDMFSAMLDSLKEESVGYLFNLNVQVVPNEQQAAADGAAAPTADGQDAGGQGGTKKVRARMKPVAALPTQQAEAAKAAQADAEAAPAALRAKGLEAPAQSAASFTYSGPGEASSSEGAAKKAAKGGTVTATKEPGRNDPCPCGSGKKYKMCHGRPSGAE